MSALWGALAVPGALAAGILIALWLSGAEFVPVMAEIVPISKWEIWSKLFADASLWVHGNGLEIVAGLGVGGGALSVTTLNWSGPGRQLADKVPPFSLYRTIAGSSFLFVVIEFLRAGVDLNERTFAQLRASSSRYTRSRITEIERRMKAGAGLGRAMVECGYGFPDPSLVAVVAALDATEGWEEKLAGFVARWARRSEEMLKRRTGFLNGALLTLAAVIMAVAVKGMFGVMSAAGGVGGL